MFAKILIANRGEIVCRVAETARRMGIATVAVYSDADAAARHVEACDEAVRIGAPPAAESYLRVEAILEAARRTGAQAIHPGYGFLSENAEFAEACNRAGLVFIGPPPAAIRDMGNKSRAKAIMEAAGVPLLPGYHGERQDAALLAVEAQRIGYPVLIKASAGGGGKGLREVERPEDFEVLLEACRRESRSSFGDETVMVEKLLPRARHIEVQVFADTHGHCIALFERDCSVQRRHQKVLEEAPAPGMTAARRSAMAEAAIEAAQAVGYVGAGTVEFLVAPDGAFFFLEMNTRLQVEHPVTEAIAGFDLVEWQLRVAAGEPLPSEGPAEPNGHAIEARIYAEDPERGFLPSTGRLIHFSPPEPSDSVRIDSGVRAGDDITAWYDPLMAKLIVWDRTRDAALMRLRNALEHFEIVGAANNVDFLSRLIATPSFIAGELDTRLIEREHETLRAPAEDPAESVLLVAVLAILLDEADEARRAAAASADPHSPWHATDGWRLNGTARRALPLTHESLLRVVTVHYGQAEYGLALDGTMHRAAGARRPGNRLRVELDGRRFEATAVLAAERVHVFLEGRSYVLLRDGALPSETRESASEGALAAPLPGRIVALLAQPGTRLPKGAPLLVLEAMKMEHTVAAPADGQLKAFRYHVGDQVAQGAQLVDFEPSSI